jgi:transcriptional regulator with XRE-family HTH domain
MPRRFKEARTMNSIKAVEAAEKLGVATPTLSAWESEKKSPPIDTIIAMAKLYNVSVDYLVGNDVQTAVSSLNPIAKDSIVLYHGRPVWVDGKGWALVNTIENVLIFFDGHKELFTDCNLLVCSPRFTEVELPASIPLTTKEITNSESVWVEPIGTEALRNELRGTYTVRGEYVENTRGCRFFLDSYLGNWVAYNAK